MGYIPRLPIFTWTLTYKTSSLQLLRSTALYNYCNYSAALTLQIFVFLHERNIDKYLHESSRFTGSNIFTKATTGWMLSPIYSGFHTQVCLPGPSLHLFYSRTCPMNYDP